MVRRVGGEFLGDRQCDEGVRPRHRAREGRRLDRRRGKVKAIRLQTKGADEVRGVRRVGGESVVRERLEWVRVGKARGLQRRWGQSWLRLGVCCLVLYCVGWRVKGLRGGQERERVELAELAPQPGASRTHSLVRPLERHHRGRRQDYL